MKGPVVAIIQARLGSSRLPLKSLLCFRGSPVIDWVTTRVARSRKVDRVLVAIPDTELDAVLADHLAARRVACFRGDENDVLGRYVNAAASVDAGTVIRVCADNPLI